jgi:hypothetical protein
MAASCSRSRRRGRMARAISSSSRRNSRHRIVEERRHEQRHNAGEGHFARHHGCLCRLRPQLG